MGTVTFHKIETPSSAAYYLAGLLNGYLHAGRDIVVLLSGGSSITVAAAAHQLLDKELSHQLTYTLTDERYGEVGHADSNWQQLQTAGLVFEEQAQALPVLTNVAFEETVAHFDATLHALLDDDRTVIALFGIGADGHIAGALPGSPAIESTDYAVGYEAPPYRRITMTPKAITKVHEAIIFAMGPTKQEQLARLADQLPLADQPAQILKEVPRVIVLSDAL